MVSNTPNPYAILVIQPENYLHSHAFDEVARSLQESLLALGYAAKITQQPIPGCRHIVFGAHLLFTQGTANTSLPPDSILYNLEQIDFSSPAFNSSMLLHFKHWTVWDYSTTNIQTLQEFGISGIQHLPIGYHPTLSSIPPSTAEAQDIDILFYGSLNQRRESVIHSLRQQGLRVEVLFGVYGAERDEIIRRSKIVLNIHNYQSKVFEIVRVSYLLANQKFVISECGTQDMDTDHFKAGLVFADYEHLVETCIHWLGRSDAERNAIALKGFDLIKQRPIEKLLTPLLEGLPESPQTDPLSHLLRVDLGCGPRKAQGYMGVDICPAPGVDLVANLTRAFPFSDSTVDELRAHDVIEHLPDRLHTMNEIWRVCKPDALVDLLVPSSDGRGAFQDPTHVSFWNINSFQYYAVEYPGYLELCRQYGFKGAFSIVALKEYQSPGEVIHVHAVLKVIKASEGFSEQVEEPIVDQMRDINFILFPDWKQPESDLFESLRTAIKLLLTAHHKAQISLLIDRSQYDEGTEFSPESLVSSIYMDLMLGEGVDIDENEPSIHFLSMSDYIDWDHIREKLTARISFAQENQSILSVLQLTDLTSLTLPRLKTYLGAVPTQS